MYSLGKAIEDTITTDRWTGQVGELALLPLKVKKKIFYNNLIKIFIIFMRKVDQLPEG